MKIAFLITSINSKSGGLGGHYHSLMETASQISKYHDVIIINIGNKEAKTLQSSNIKIYEIIYPGFLVLKTYKELKKILTCEKPDVLHAFDVLAYYWVRFFGRQLQTPYCLTKCGGVNPKYYFPYTKNLVLFSNENFIFFKKKYKFHDTSLYLIPNRVRLFNDDIQRINEINRTLGRYKSSFKFLRICRIGTYYRNSIHQLINLVNQLRSDGLDCCAIFIGVVEDKWIFKEFKDLKRDYLFFFTSESFTKNAKELINCSDAVLGTGRNFMEAMAKGKIMLCPLSNAIYPALVNSEIFQAAFDYNFSERLCLDNYKENENYYRIKEVVKNENIQKELYKFSKLSFEEFFDSKNIAVKYNEVYSGLKFYKKTHSVDFFMHTLFIIRSYFR